MDGLELQLANHMKVGRKSSSTNQVTMKSNQAYKSKWSKMIKDSTFTSLENFVSDE